MDYQRTNRNKFHYTCSRFFTLKTTDSDVEIWMYIDEYEDQEAYNKTTKALQSDVEIAKLKKEFVSLRVPNSFKTEVWTEKPELRV